MVEQKLVFLGKEFIINAVTGTVASTRQFVERRRASSSTRYNFWICPNDGSKEIDTVVYDFPVRDGQMITLTRIALGDKTWRLKLINHASASEYKSSFYNLLGTNVPMLTTTALGWVFKLSIAGAVYVFFKFGGMEAGAVIGVGVLAECIRNVLYTNLKKQIEQHAEEVLQKELAAVTKND